MWRVGVGRHQLYARHARAAEYLFYAKVSTVVVRYSIWVTGQDLLSTTVVKGDGWSQFRLVVGRLQNAGPGTENALLIPRWPHSPKGLTTFGPPCNSDTKEFIDRRSALSTIARRGTWRTRQ